MLNILPATIVQRINRGEVAIADRFPEATILFSDLVGFTSLAGRSSPGQIIEILNRLFSSFDALAKQLGLEKIKTIGDAYMVAGGLPEQRPDHAAAVADMAIKAIASTRFSRKWSYFIFDVLLDPVESQSQDKRSGRMCDALDRSLGRP